MIKRRNALRGLALSLAGTHAVWKKPVIESVLLPVHANTSRADVILRFTDTVGDASTGEGVNPGDPLIIDVLLNNGNNSIQNQTWTYSDLISVTIRAGNSYSVVIKPENNLSPSTEGEFETNGSGELISILQNWHSFETNGLDIDSNGGSISRWFLSQGNPITEGSSAEILSVLGGVDDISLWEVLS